MSMGVSEAEPRDLVKFAWRLLYQGCQERRETFSEWECEMRLIKSIALGLLGIAGVVGSASAAPVPWSNPNGSTPDFDWSGGFSDNGLFGSPTVVGSTFLFFPANFKAQSTNGVAATVSDRLEFNLLIKNNKKLTGFTVNELGDYQITGTGTVSAGGQLVLTNLDSGVFTADNLHATPAMPISGQTAGALTWSGYETVSLLPNGWSFVKVVLNNILDATSGPNSAATIQKKVASAGIEITIIIPEPASLSLLGLGGLLLVRRRK